MSAKAAVLPSRAVKARDSATSRRARGMARGSTRSRRGRPRLPRPHPPLPVAHARGSDRARQACRAGRRGGVRPDDRVQPTPRRRRRSNLRGAGRRLGRPRAGGLYSLDARGRAVRLAARRQVLHIRHLVDPQRMPPCHARRCVTAPPSESVQPKATPARLRPGAHGPARAATDERRTRKSRPPHTIPGCSRERNPRHQPIPLAALTPIGEDALIDRIADEPADGTATSRECRRDAYCTRPLLGYPRARAP